MSGNPYFKSLPRSEHIYRKYYDEFMKRRNELNVQTIDEALECIFNEWSSKYCASTLSTRLSGIIQIMRTEKVIYSDNTYRSIIASIQNMKRNTAPRDQTLTFTEEEFANYMNFDHTKSLIILRNKIVLLFGMALLLRGEESRFITRNCVIIKEDGINASI